MKEHGENLEPKRLQEQRVVDEREKQHSLGKRLHRRVLESYNRRLRDEPFNANLHVRKGEALLGLGHPQEALAAYEDAIRLAPDLSEAYRGRGKVYEHLAQQTYDELKQQAQECYKKAEQLGTS